MEESDEVLERIQRKHSSWGDKNFADYSAMETLGDVARLLEGRMIPDVESFEILIRSLQECDQYKHSFADALGQSNSTSFDLNSKKKRKSSDKKGDSSDDEESKIGGLMSLKKKERSSQFGPPGTLLANFGVPESSIAKAQSSQFNGNNASGNSIHNFTNDNKVPVEPLTMNIAINSDSANLFLFFDQIRKRYGDESRVIVQIYMDIVGKYASRRIDYLACTSMLQYLFRENPQLVAQSLNISDIDYFVDGNGSILTLSATGGQYLSSYMQKSSVSSHNAQLINCRKRISNKLSSDPIFRERFLAAQALQAATTAAAAAAAQASYSYSYASQNSASGYKPLIYPPFIPPRTEPPGPIPSVILPRTGPPPRGPPFIPRVIPPNTGSGVSYANSGMVNSQLNRPVQQAVPIVAKPIVPEPVVPEDFREYLLAVKAALSKDLYHKFLDAMIGIKNNFNNNSTSPRLQYEAIRFAKSLLPEKVKYFRKYLEKYVIEV